VNVERKKSGINNNRGNWNHLKIIQKIPEQYTSKALNQGTTVNSHMGHCTHTLESSNVKVQNTEHEK
jgi:hypothetical protein